MGAPHIRKKFCFFAFVGFLFCMKGVCNVRVLLAVGEPNLSKILRKHLVNYKFEVLDTEVFHRKYLDDILSSEYPDIVIIHDTYLPSEKEESKEREAEILQMIESWRITYEDKLRIVYLCERNRDDPFLRNLVARNVLDIFYTRSISAKKMMTQLSEPPKFSNVSRLGVGEIELDVEILDEEEPEQPPKGENPKKDANENEIHENAEEKMDAEFKSKQFRPKIPNLFTSIATKEPKEDKAPREKKRRGKEEELVSDFEEDLIEMMPVEQEVLIREKIVGTVVIAVTSVATHIGSTHTSIAIASFLQKKGHSVALVEANYSEDFERIHSLSVGKTQPLKNDTSFEINGIKHYKFRPDLPLGKILTSYKFVILDMGETENTPLLSELFRAHIKCVVCSGEEWKQHWIYQFRNRFGKQGDFIYLVPFAEGEILEDIKKIVSPSPIYSLPLQVSPYEVNPDSEKTFNHLLKDYLEKETAANVVSRKTVFIASLISVVVTITILSTIFLLN